MRQTLLVLRRLAALLLTTTLIASACADAPDPGDLAIFCDLLRENVGLDASSVEADYARLALVATPEIRPTIESLQRQARDFDELMSEEPPDLAALFSARFDPQAERQRAELDRFAADSCGVVVDRPASTRWANWARENHPSAPWRGAATPSFDTGADQISAATFVFEEAPEAMVLVEDVCRAAADFLVADGAADAAVRVLIGTVVVLEQADASGSCRLP